MKKLIAVLLSICTVLISGCSRERCGEHGANITDTLLADFDNFIVTSQKYTKYNADICNMQEGRVAEIGLTEIFRYNNSVSLEISSAGVQESNNACFAADGYCPVSSLFKMTGTSTFDQALTSVGQPYTYTELGDKSALLLADKKQTLIYGNANRFSKVTLGDKYNITSVISLQITDEKLFVFSYPEAKNGKCVVVRNLLLSDSTSLDEIVIPFSDIGFEDFNLHISKYNIFVNNDTLFFIAYDLDKRCGWIIAYNLNTKQYSNIRIENIAGVEQIFCADDGIIVLYNKYDSNGYSNNTFLCRYGFDYASTTFSQESVSVITFPENANYYFSTKGQDSYCVGDTFCGILENTRDMSYAYAEFSLSTGKITTFIPFKPKSSNYAVTGLIIRDNGKAVSRHNCGV